MTILNVGPNSQYHTLDEALAAYQPGDKIAIEHGFDIASSAIVLTAQASAVPPPPRVLTMQVRVNGVIKDEQTLEPGDQVALSIL